ncbi:MAG: DUF3524 domain-containing protein [Gammaproteobacteria bacterium]|nr:MAG: DUF3524 domain-containing protein [Gammaproteobacteria bacterium]
MAGTRSRHILALEPWFSGSHRQFLEGLRQHSRHRIHLMTLPGRYWKWRQTGSGMQLANRFLEQAPRCDLLFASDFLQLNDFLALTRHRLKQVPVVVYFHENQLGYPLQASHNLDRAYPLINIASTLSADILLFNSEYHLNTFLDDLDVFLRACPDHALDDPSEIIQQKAQVMPMGLDLPAVAERNRQSGSPLTILWNHRWEHDKNPEDFFELLFRLHDQGLDFRLAVAGQQFKQRPAIFDQAHERLSDRIIHWGYIPDREHYIQLLQQSDIVISMANHDYFGISVIEAMSAGCFPLLAKRLNYPYLIPAEHHSDHLAENCDELQQKLIALLEGKIELKPESFHEWASQYDWHDRIKDFDSLFSTVEAL